MRLHCQAAPDRPYAEPDGEGFRKDGWRAYEGLVDLGYEKHFRVHHGANEFAEVDHHINGIESFWA